MQEQLISFEAAKLAKEKGFIQSFSYSQYINIKDDNWVLYTKEEADSIDNSIGIGENIRCSVPTQSLLQKWLREKYNIDITIHRSFSMDKSYHYCIIIDNDYENEKQQEVIPNRTYEQALEEGLLESLKII